MLALSCHEDFELAWVHEGIAYYRVGSKEYAVGPGAVILMPRGQEHQTRIPPGTRASSVHLEAELVAGVADALGPRYQRRELEAGLVPAPDRLLRLAGLLVLECTESGPGSVLAADSLAEALTVQVLRRAPQQASSAGCHDARIARALQAIEASGGADLDVSELASVAGMSRYHFSRMFREVTGASPYQHLLGVRLARAAELLRGGHVSVTEAALSAGFTDFGRFAAQFQRWRQHDPHVESHESPRNQLRRQLDGCESWICATGGNLWPRRDY